MTVSWSDFDGPDHEGEMAASHEGRPTVAEQNVTHGAPAPAVDLGADDRAKYQ